MSHVARTSRIFKELKLTSITLNVKIRITCVYLLVTQVRAQRRDGEGTNCRRGVDRYGWEGSLGVSLTKDTSAIDAKKTVSLLNMGYVMGVSKCG
jgi:hypothetical protein